MSTARRRTSCRSNDPRTAWALTRGLIVAIALPIALAGACWWVSAIAYLIVVATLQTSRWILAFLGLGLIRWYVVRRTRPYRETLGPAGRITDPRAPWRQWLDTRCHVCGS